MSKQAKTTSINEGELAALLADNLTVSQIAEKLHYSPQTVRYAIRIYNLPFPKKRNSQSLPHHQFNTFCANEVKGAHVGMTYADMAARYGVSTTSISMWRTKYNASNGTSNRKS